MFASQNHIFTIWYMPKTIQSSIIPCSAGYKIKEKKSYYIYNWQWRRKGMYGIVCINETEAHLWVMLIVKLKRKITMKLFFFAYAFTSAFSFLVIFIVSSFLMCPIYTLNIKHVLKALLEQFRFELHMRTFFKTKFTSAFRSHPKHI